VIIIASAAGMWVILPKTIEKLSENKNNSSNNVIQEGDTAQEGDDDYVSTNNKEFALNSDGSNKWGKITDLTKQQALGLLLDGSPVPKNWVPDVLADAVQENTISNTAQQKVLPMIFFVDSYSVSDESNMENFFRKKRISIKDKDLEIAKDPAGTFHLAIYSSEYSGPQQNKEIIVLVSLNKTYVNLRDETVGNSTNTVTTFNKLDRESIQKTTSLMVYVYSYARGLYDYSLTEEGNDFIFTYHSVTYGADWGSMISGSIKYQINLVEEKVRISKTTKDFQWITNDTGGRKTVLKSFNLSDEDNQKLSNTAAQ
jgi:hypothetical protein